jgi:hypothetical protein
VCAASIGSNSLTRSRAQDSLFPQEIRVTLIAEDDPRARATPVWIAGLASGQHDIAIFPERIGAYPYDSLESVVWHKFVLWRRRPRLVIDHCRAEPETATSYLLAAALVSDLRQRHGAAVPGAIVDRVARGADFAEAFALETGETPD